MSGSVVQVVWAHPRTTSLTAAIASDVITELQLAGMSVAEIDLYRIPFDPVLREQDEPQWDDLDAQYSADVMASIAQTREADAVVFVFPVWWYSFPAMLKGYIDRVWNHGYFYGGGRRIGVKSILWLGLAGDTDVAFAKRNYAEMMANHLNVGIAGYCGAQSSRLELLHNTLGEGIDDMPGYVAKLRETARASVRALAEELPRL